MDRSKWEYKKLGEVAQYPKNRLESEFLDVGNYVGVENLLKDKAGRIDAISLPANTSTIEYMENDILIGNIRPYLKKIWLADRHGGASGDVVNIRVKEYYRDRICPNFLYCVLSTDAFFDFDMAHSKGAKMPRGNKDEIVKYSIPIPPIADQQRIVAELDCLNEMIALKQEQLKEFDKLAQSIFYDMFGNPVANDKDWESSSFGDCIKLRSGDGLSAKEIVSGDYPVYGGNGIVGYHNEFNLDEDAIIIGRVGALCGNVRNVRGRIFVTDNAFILSQLKVFDNVFLKHLLEILNLRKFAREAMQPVISNKTLKDVKIPLPPLALQQQFAEKIQAIEAQKELVKKSIAETQQLLDSRMDFYFD